MTQHQSLLCVGGPRAGQRFAIHHGNGFSVPILEKTSQDDPDSPDYMPNKAPTVAFTDYRKEVFHTPEGEVSFWVPMGQTPLATITMLLESYERAESASITQGAPK